MPNSFRSAARGLSIIEVLIALAILGIVSVAYMQTTRFAQQNTTKSIDWQAEASAVEKAIENLRTGHTVAQLQMLDSSWIDTTQGTIRVQVRARGGIPPASVANGFPADRLAQITVVAKRTTYQDSMSVTTYLWVN